MTFPEQPAPEATGRPGSATWPAAVVAIALLAVSGAAYRAAARYLARPSTSQPLPEGALAKLPMVLGEWIGSEAPMDEAVIRATDTDAHISRTYTRAGRSIGLFVAYGVRTRDLAPHRPDVCYPGSGWTLQSKTPVAVARSTGGVSDCTLYRFGRAGIEVRTVTVLNYYIVDGRVCSDVSALRATAWRGSAGVRYLAQVQITCPGGAFVDEAAAERATVAFAAEAIDEIRALFPDDDRITSADSAAAVGAKP